MFTFIVNKVPFKENAIATTIGPFVFIEKSHANDKGVIEHEKFHAKMFTVWSIPSIAIALAMFLFGIVGLWTAIPLMFLGAGARAIAYNFIERYRVWEEVEGYKRQLEIQGFTDANVTRYATIIFNNYNVKKTTWDKIRLSLLDD